jgi:diguanylate cyclase (GGDEF)-like protein
MSVTVKFLNYLDGQDRVTLWSFTVLLLVCLGLLDYFTGTQLSISLFYLLPVSLASWSLGLTPGRIVALISSLVLQGSNLLAGEQLSPSVTLWNTVTRLGIFLIFASLISELHTLLEQQTELSHTDSLTGILNRRAFYEAAGVELKRVERYGRPLRVAFMDLDDFKAFNDTFGHITGDALLRRVAGRIKRQLRGTDFVARLGGDEYGLLLPETNEAAAEAVISRLQYALNYELAEYKWPVTFSIGVLICHTAPPDADAMVHLADQLMYKAKRCGKSCIEYGSYPQRLEENQLAPTKEMT